jgi:hypothetical protein
MAKARRSKVKLGKRMAGPLGKSKTNAPLAKATRSTGAFGGNASPQGGQAASLLGKGPVAASSGPTSAAQFTTNSGAPHPLAAGLLNKKSPRKGKQKVKKSPFGAPPARY